MTKDMVRREQLEAEVDGPKNPNFDGFDDITAPCDACGEENVGVGTPVMMAIPGMIFPSTEYGVPMFIPDPDVKIRIVRMPNGALGFVTDEKVTKYLHEECYTDLINEVAYGMHDGSPEEEEEEEEPEDE